ncbi:unnamed protein product [Schistosoma curassoni]|uniref:UmuC domain-containing protein n=1 Tax=Schistosoma curassoni TaxID=6186 RepID=A0A183JQ51_9TREM|nr:unnamed protein product [Schistosoma curassoni]
MIRCGLFGLYINPVCLKEMIHIAEAEIGVLDLTLDCSYRFYASLVRSTNHCSLIGGIITSYINRAKATLSGAYVPLNTFQIPYFHSSSSSVSKKTQPQRGPCQ